MIQAKAVHLFLLLMGSHGDVLGRSVEADVKNKASAVQLDRLLDEDAIPSLKKGPPWSDFDGASAIYSGPGPPNLSIEDKEAHLLLDDEATPSLKKGPPWPDLDGASAVYSGPGPPNLLSEEKEVRTNE